MKFFRFNKKHTGSGHTGSGFIKNRQLPVQKRTRKVYVVSGLNLPSQETSEIDFKVIDFGIYRITLKKISVVQGGLKVSTRTAYLYILDAKVGDVNGVPVYKQVRRKKMYI